MPSLYTSNDHLQFASPIQLANSLWNDNEWIAEELFSGYRALITSGQGCNSIFLSKKCCNGYGLGKVLTNNFLHIRDLPIFKTEGHCELDCTIVSNQKPDLEQIFDMGPLGAEKLNEKHDLFKVVLLDILTFKGIDVRGEPWKVRRIYLEDIHKKLESPHVLLSEAVSSCKRSFFDVLSASGSKGVVLKNTEYPYQNGMSRCFLEARSSTCAGFKNVTLQDGFIFSPVVSSQANSKSFDFDTYLAMQALDKKENIDKLLSL